MTRGMTGVYYQSDILKMFAGSTDDTPGRPIPAQFITDRPDVLIAQTELGWSTDLPTPTGPAGIRLPKRIRPRHAIGVDPSGRRHKVTIATLGASAWGNTALTWTSVPDDGTTPVTVTVTGFVGEAATV